MKKFSSSFNCLKKFSFSPVVVENQGIHSAGFADILIILVLGIAMLTLIILMTSVQKAEIDELTNLRLQVAQMNALDGLAQLAATAYSELNANLDTCSPEVDPD